MENNYDFYNIDDKHAKQKYINGMNFLKAGDHVSAKHEFQLAQQLDHSTAAELIMEADDTLEAFGYCEGVTMENHCEAGIRLYSVITHMNNIDQEEIIEAVSGRAGIKYHLKRYTDALNDYNKYDAEFF